ncbi:MAG: aromatic-ring-hydroxylating dioxygenase subunit beta [Lautropia sp.]
MTPNSILWELTQFLWKEAELLDRRRYTEWLQLWKPEGRYVVPTDPDAIDFEDRINYIFDDDSMRTRRVERLLSGFTTSERPPTRTTRSVSCVRVVEDAEGRWECRSSLMLVAYRRGTQELLSGEVTHVIERLGSELKIARKVARLVQLEGNMTDISYLI